MIKMPLIILFFAIFQATSWAESKEPRYSVTKATYIPYQGDLVSTDIFENQAAENMNDLYYVLAICAPEILSYSSEEKAMKAVKNGLSGFILLSYSGDGPPLTLARISNLFSMGPGFVYLNDVHHQKFHTHPQWTHISFSNLVQFRYKPNEFMVQSEFFSITANQLGKAEIKSRWSNSRENRTISKPDYFCSWNKTANTSYSR